VQLTKVVGAGVQVHPVLAFKSVAVIPWGRKSLTVTGFVVEPVVDVTPVLPTVIVYVPVCPTMKVAGEWVLVMESVGPFTGAGSDTL
jgi:hypothetical protein